MPKVPHDLSGRRFDVRLIFESDVTQTPKGEVFLASSWIPLHMFSDRLPWSPTLGRDGLHARIINALSQLVISLEVRFA
jgi:hypothetical protein